MTSRARSSECLRQRVAALSREDARALRADAQQLRATDLRALASTPAEAAPLPFVSALLASTRCLLLEPSCEPVVLTAPPWPLLRLELLADAPRMLERMHARLRALRIGASDRMQRRHRAERISRAQRRFVYRALAPLMVEGGGCGGGGGASGLLGPIARESSTGAHLAAWVFSCLYHSEKRSRASSGGDAVATATCGARYDGGELDGEENDSAEDQIDSDENDDQAIRGSPMKLPRLPRATLHTQIQATEHFAKHDTRARNAPKSISVRAGVKIGGRFFLFQASVGDSGTPHSTPILQQIPQPQKELYTLESVTCAVLRIETRRKATEVVRRLEATSGSRTLPESPEAKTSAAPDGFWNPPRRLPPHLARVVCHERLYERLSPLALTTTLFQLALLGRAFEKWNTTSSPTLNIASTLLEVPILLKFAVIQVFVDSRTPHRQYRNSRGRLILSGIGSATIHSSQTIADLRTVIQRTVDVKRMRSANLPTLSSFQFLHRDSLIPKLMEASLSVVVLMPVALVCEAPVSPSFSSSGQVQASAFRVCPPHLHQLHYSISILLRNAGPPNHLLLHPELAEKPAPAEPIEMETAVSYFEMQQDVADVDPSATSAVVAEFFVNWRAFAHFQQLQDSTMVLEEHFPAHVEQHHRKRVRKLYKSEAQRIAEFQIEAENHRLQLLQSNQPRLLPSRRFRPDHEYLKPLYATADVKTASTAILTTPFVPELSRVLSDLCSLSASKRTRSRLVLYDDDFVIHLQSVSAISTSERDSTTSELQSPSFEIAFERDESCPAEALLLLRNAYVWQVIDARTTNKSQHQTWNESVPDKWLRDVQRRVIHPILDFENDREAGAQFTFFRVPICCKRVERMIEHGFWSKDVDWRPFLDRTPVRETVLRKKYDAMCHSHPPSISIDSVKFSKLLREIGLQPQVLSIGDAAFLFASHMASGSHYEMDYDGFVAALERVASMVYPESPSKRGSDVGRRHYRQHHNGTGVGAVREMEMSKLSRLFFEQMVMTPSMVSIWHELIESWRLECKIVLLTRCAREYGAATRIQSLWKRYLIRCIHMRALAHMKAERKAAAKIQSAERRRRAYQPFQRLKHSTIQVQRRVRARRELRRLRQERAAFVEAMRIRIVKWMRRRLRVLQEWKKINARWIARRERVWAKRKRLICAAVHHLEARSYQFSLYHADYNASKDIANVSSLSVDSSLPIDTYDDNKYYELEITEPMSCWWRLVRVPVDLVEQFIREEKQLISRQGYNTAIISTTVTGSMDANKEGDGQSQSGAAIVGNRTMKFTNGPRGSKVRCNDLLDAIVKRLRLLKGSAWSQHQQVERYRNPMQTSLGKLVFSGAVRSSPHQLPPIDAIAVEFGGGDHQVHDYDNFLFIVRVLQNMNVFKVLVYSPDRASLQRWDLSSSFFHRVLQFMRFRGMTLCSDRDSIVETPSSVEDRQALFVLVEIFKDKSPRTTLAAIRALVSYLLRFGLQIPEYENMAEVVAEKARERIEKDILQLKERRAREVAYAIFIQTRVRRMLARKYRLRLALATYRKQRDVETGSFVYVNRFHESDSRADGAAPYYREKPRSLLNCDVPPPVDEWQPVLESAIVDPMKAFFNPYRGQFSQFNEQKAASRIQSWYRAKMWIGISQWGLPQLARALQYHSQEHAEPPVLTELPLAGVDPWRRHALYLHTIQHEFNDALSVYEAVLKVQPEDVEMLAGLALLLIYSCRYPTKKTWPRALELLTRAQTLSQELAGVDLSERMKSIEENCVCWKLYLDPTNANAIGSYAVFQQYIYRELDKAELLYRRAISAAPSNELVIKNYRRLERERTPEGIYHSAGPSKIARWRAEEVERVGSHWAIMEDSAARIPSAQRFYRNVVTGACQWEAPEEEG